MARAGREVTRSKIRVPRKIKKALKQIEPAPRIQQHSWFQTIQFGIHSIRGRRTKWTRKAEKVFAAREGVKCHDYLCDALRSLPPATTDYSKVAKEMGDLYFEWEVIPNYK